MKIVVLDGYALNPGDLSWQPIQALGDFTVYPRTLPEQVVERASAAQVVLLNKVAIGEKELSQLPHLRYIGVLATGYDVVDVQAARRHNVIVTNIPAYSTASVAQMVFAHLLNITQQVRHYAAENSKGRWKNNADFCYWDSPLIELHGKSIGLVGFGKTAQATALLARAFGMKLIAYTSKPQSQLPADVEKKELDALFATADVVSLHCPYTVDTYHLANASRIGLMKSTAIFINTARGPLVDEVALAEALNAKRIFAAGLDVLPQEPPVDDSPLLHAQRCFITPHIAWATREARERLMELCIQNLQAFLAKCPRNVVS